MTNLCNDNVLKARPSFNGNLITPATSVLLLIFNSLIWLLGHIQQIGTGKHKKTMDTLQTKFALWSFTWVTNIC